LKEKSPLKSSLEAIAISTHPPHNFLDGERITMRLSLIDKLFNAFISSKGEKRREPRREDELPVEIEILSDETNPGPSSMLYAQIKDISAGGVKVWTSVYIPIHTPVKLKIRLLKLGETIGPTGKVVWGNQLEDCDIYEMGIEFENTQPEILCALLEYIYTDWE
jgi:c-di-GMP-binding flagellar brake protein YcgR